MGMLTVLPHCKPPTPFGVVLFRRKAAALRRRRVGRYAVVLGPPLPFCLYNCPVTAHACLIFHCHMLAGSGLGGGGKMRSVRCWSRDVISYHLVPVSRCVVPLICRCFFDLSARPVFPCLIFGNDECSFSPGLRLATGSMTSSIQTRHRENDFSIGPLTSTGAERPLARSPPLPRGCQENKGTLNDAEIEAGSPTTALSMSITGSVTALLLPSALTSIFESQPILLH
ncbi:hypothetical protein IW262DRAFT_907638 [Armillaria fumosa]|nr:hypothetical protein IW262DRAFT_907638 [Armillaria fumosa]